MKRFNFQAQFKISTPKPSTSLNDSPLIIYHINLRQSYNMTRWAVGLDLFDPITQVSLYDENVSFSDSGPAPEPLVLGVISGEESSSLAPGGCVSHTENSLKKITLVNCLIIIILILVIAANINEGKLIKVIVIEYRDISTKEIR